MSDFTQKRAASPDRAPRRQRRDDNVQRGGEMKSKWRVLLIVSMLCVGLTLYLINVMFPPRLKFPISISENPKVVNDAGRLVRDEGHEYYSNVNRSSRLYKKGDNTDEPLSDIRGTSNIFLIGDTVFFKSQGLYSVGTDGRNRKAIHRGDVFEVAAVDEHVFYSAQTKGTWDNIRKIDMFHYNAQTGRKHLALEDAMIICITKHGMYFRQILDYGVDRKKDYTGYSSRFCFLDFSSGEVSVVSDEWPTAMKANDKYVYYTSRETGGGLYRANPDMSDPIWIADQPIGFNVTENYLFFWDRYLLMRTDLDGGNKRQIHDSGGEITSIVALTEKEILIWVKSNVAPYLWYCIMDMDGENLRRWPE